MPASSRLNTPPPILSSADYPQATAFLAGLDEDWARLVTTVGPCRHAPKPAREPYEALVRAIAYQQLHARAAEAILGRLLALYPDERFPSPESLLATDPAAQRACGLSVGKLTAIRGIAQATLDGIVPSRAEALPLDDETLIKRLVPLRGVGRWTVEMFLIYTLERADVLPVDDFGVREGYRRLKGLTIAPTPARLRTLGAHWQPWRTVAAWYLWRTPQNKDTAQAT